MAAAAPPPPRRRRVPTGRASALALTASLVAAAGPAEAAKRPPPVPCLSYAPQVVELIGILHRESFEQQPIEDLFVDPNVLEVEGSPPAALLPPAAALPAAPADAGMAEEAAPLPWPADAIGPPPPPPPPPDPVLMRATPVKRPLPREQVWVLTLPKPACVSVEPGDLINEPVKGIRRMQLVVERSLEPGFRLLLKKRVVVRGQLFHATTRRHYLPILINVEELRPPEMVQDWTQTPPPPP